MSHNKFIDEDEESQELNIHPAFDEFDTDRGEVVQEARNAKRPGLVKVLALLGLVVLLGIIIAIGVYFGVAKKDESSESVTQIFYKSVDGQSILASLKHLTSAPHLAGTPTDYDTALYVRDTLSKYGFQAQIQQVNVLLSYPGERTVELIYPSNYKCGLVESPVPEDPTSSDPRSVPTFNAYSASGAATGELVYVNYGRYEDFAYLDKNNISLKDKIVIARYGKIFRANKCKQAQDRGAVGCLIYSDPIDDGYVRGKVYPEGPWRPESSVQRGTAYVGEGDPLTPGWPSYPYAPRNTIEQARDPELMGEWTLPTIPIQPLSYGDAYRLLQALGVNPAPADWQGGLNFTYHIGPGPAQVHMNIESNLTVTPIWNVIGIMQGAVEPDRVIILGNHRDAWVFGAGDPSSGTAAMLEIAKGIYEMTKTGWKPRRSIMIASWDAEEYGLVGSVEWVEANFNLLQTQAVAYINVDIAIAGNPVFRANCVPSLDSLIINVTKNVKAPPNAKSPLDGSTLETVYDMWAASPSGAVPGTLGSGSDFTPFLQHAGIPAADLRILDLNGSYQAAYHSIYDSYYWMTKFGDPTGEYFQAIARVWGMVALRLSEDLFLPFNFTRYGIALREYAMQAENLAKSAGQHGIDFTVLHEAVARYQAAVSVFNTEIAHADLSNPFILRALNDRMMASERAFIDYKGLPGRNWLRHVIFAPGKYDTYAGSVLPALIDAIVDKNWDAVRFQIRYISIFIDAAAKALRGQIE